MERPLSYTVEEMILKSSVAEVWGYREVTSHAFSRIYHFIQNAFYAV